MYHSTIPQRTRPITADDFDALEGTCLTAKSRRDGKMRLDFWNKYIPVTPADIVKIADAVAIPDLKLTCLNDEGGYLGFSLSDGGDLIKEVSFEFDLDKQRLNHSLTHLKKHQTGAGSRLFKMQHDLAASFGHSSITVSTDMKGGLVWPKRGYEIDPSFNTQPLSQAIQGRLMSIKDCLPPALFANMKMWANLSDRDDINHLAAQDFILPDRITIDDYYQAGGHRGKELSRMFTDAVSGAKYINGLSNEMNELRALIERRDRDGVVIRLNEFLLSGTQYRIRLDFTDERQMKKVEAHAGPFQFIQQIENPIRSNYCKARGFAI